MQVTCSSRILEAVVHARGALVTRRVQVPSELADGCVDLLVPGITITAAPGSVRAAVPQGSRRLVSVRTSVVVPEEKAEPGPTLRRLEEIDRHIARLQREAELVTQDRSALLQLEPDAGLAVRWLPIAPADRVAGALLAAQTISDWSKKAGERELQIAQELEQLQRDRELAQLEDQHSSSADRMGEAHPFHEVCVRVEGEGPLAHVDLVYLVQAARWWPLYTLRIGREGEVARWIMEAIVAQRSGEDWNGVRVGLSTADLISDASLPELHSLRFGRAQPPPARGYRAPPQDLDRLFAGYDRGFEAAPPRREVQRLQEKKKRRAPPKADVNIPAPGAAPPPPPPPMATLAAFAPAPQAAPSPAMYTEAGMVSDRCMAKMDHAMPARAKSASLSARLGRAFMEAEEAEEDESPPEEPAPQFEPDSAWLDFDALEMAPAGTATRGRLRRLDDSVSHQARAEADLSLSEVAPLEAVRDPLDSRGSFDHRYDVDGLADIPSDSRLHRVAVCAADAPMHAEFRTVPRESPDVFREAVLSNPFAWPLLDGPVDVYSEGTLLTTTQISRIGSGGTLRVGMGVEQRIRVARNARVDEETTGMFGGTTAVNHTVSIEASSSLGFRAKLEVLDRIPDTDDKDVTVKLLSSQPPGNAYTQAERGAPVRGGMQWILDLSPGAKASVEFKYRITLPSKSELVGGNRRD